MKENQIEVILLLVLTLGAFLGGMMVSKSTPSNIQGISYSDYNVIYYDSDETLLHEVCHVVVDNDPKDYFIDNKLERYCK